MAWNIDKAHSEVGFAVKHMMISTVRGKFASFDADVELDPANLSAAKVTARIDAKSLDTNEEKRDGHLRSPDFFDVEKYPTLTFTSTKVTGSAEEVEVAGTLKIKDQEHPVTLKGEVTGPSKDPWGNLRVGFSLSGEIERERWGLGWNQALEAGGVLVGKKVKIVLEAQLVKGA
ncbi:MAG TPA: YceI family protein [Polyangiaceae bacterium]|nr:YceI family protein [Polyangiaceae bacterium]